MKADRLMKLHTREKVHQAKEKKKHKKETLIIKKRAESLTCKRCSKDFNSNSKLYRHVRE